jgi:hypothetical protein
VLTAFPQIPCDASESENRLRRQGRKEIQKIDFLALPGAIAPAPKPGLGGVREHLGKDGFWDVFPSKPGPRPRIWRLLLFLGKHLEKALLGFFHLGSQKTRFSTSSIFRHVS